MKVARVEFLIPFPLLMRAALDMKSPMNRECAEAIAGFVFDLCQFYYAHGEITDTEVRDRTSDFFLNYFLENDSYDYQPEWIDSLGLEKVMHQETDQFKQILNQHLKNLLALAEKYAMHKQERAEFLYFPLSIGDESIVNFIGDNGVGLDEME